MTRRWPEISSAAEFARLRSSTDPAEYERAAWAEMPRLQDIPAIYEYRNSYPHYDAAELTLRWPPTADHSTRAKCSFTEANILATVRVGH